MPITEEMTVDTMPVSKMIITDTYLHKMTVYGMSVTEHYTLYDTTQVVCKWNECRQHVCR